MFMCVACVCVCMHSSGWKNLHLNLHCQSTKLLAVVTHRAGGRDSAAASVFFFFFFPFAQAIVTYVTKYKHGNLPG